MQVMVWVGGRAFVRGGAWGRVRACPLLPHARSHLVPDGPRGPFAPGCASSCPPCGCGCAGAGVGACGCVRVRAGACGFVCRCASVRVRERVQSLRGPGSLI